MKKFYFFSLLCFVTAGIYAQEQVPPDPGRYDINLQEHTVSSGQEKSFHRTVKSVTSNPAVGADEQDSLVLVAFYDSTGGASWTNNANWLTDSVYKWYGVSLDSAGRITAIEMWNNQLNGALPAELGNLSNLQVLNLGSNQLGGTIPVELRNLSNLQVLMLNSNQLSGGIPAELGNLSLLQVLDLTSNKLSGTIPTELGNLSNLEELNMYGNQLSGSIPGELGDLSKLQRLNLGGNQLTGSIPAQLGNLSGLIEMSLGDNQLNGPIPAELGNLSHLQTLHLGYNQLNGSIPAELGNLSELDDMVLDGNRLSGSIPSGIGNPSYLRNLSLDNNQLTGSIPPEIGNLSHLQYLSMGGNQLSGPIPAEIGNLSQLYSLSLPGNQLSGIPAEIGNLSNLHSLNLWGNQLSGSIPPEIGNLTSIEYIYFNGNQLTGAIPAEIGKLTTCKRLVLSYNQLSGTIPAEIGEMGSLEELRVNQNQLSGAIPPEIRNLTKLKRFYLNNNRFDSLPDLSGLSGLSSMNIDENNFTFEDIEPNMGIQNFCYSPQAKLDSVRHYTPNAGDDLTFTVTVGGTANSYQWYKDGAAISGATDSTYTIHGYNVDNDKGIYACKINNTICPNLTLETANYYVGVDVTSYNINLSGNPSAGGSVSGAGSYHDGDVATVTATPGNGYIFLNWMEFGSVIVSFSESYSFTVSEDRDLTANFTAVTTIEDEKEQETILYPNPVNNVINIRIAHLASGHHSVVLRIVDMQGRSILLESQQAGPGLVRADVSALPAGYYILVITGDQSMKTIRFVKKR